MNNLAASEFLGLIGNEKRLAILKMLLEREMTVSTLADEVSLSLSAMSQHLAELRSAGLVETRQRSSLIWYSCNSDAVRRTLRTLGGIFDDRRQCGECNHLVRGSADIKDWLQRSLRTQRRRGPPVRVGK